MRKVILNKDGSIKFKFVLFQRYNNKRITFFRITYRGKFYIEFILNNIFVRLSAGPTCYNLAIYKCHFWR